MAQLINVRLSRSDAQPWGFRLQGGIDFATPLVIQKVNGGSIADTVGLVAGDTVIKVNSTEVFNLRHKDAQDAIVRAGNSFEVTVQRGGSTWKPSVTPTPGNLPSPMVQMGTGHPGPVTKTSLAHKQPEMKPIGTGYNNAARPFNTGAGVAPMNGGGGVDPVKSIVNKQYNTPVGMYSEESIAETLSAQAEVLAGGVLGVNFKKNERMYNSANSEVYKMLHEQDNDYEEPETKNGVYPAPTQQPIQVTKHVSAPPVDRPKAPTTAGGGLPAGQNICTECERLIVGVFVRIKDKNLHVDCFKCATCGTSLKNQGYFNIGNKLYCDIHAKLVTLKKRAQPHAANTNGYATLPTKLTQKANANMISNALNNHGMNGGGGGGSMQGSYGAVPPPTYNPHEFVSPSHSRTSSSASSTASSGQFSLGSSGSSSLSNGATPIHSREGSNTSSPLHATDNMTNGGHGQLSNFESMKRAVADMNARNGVAAPPPPPPPPAPLSSTIINDQSIQNGGHFKETTIYGSILPLRIAGEEFNYKTLDGSVIRSVQPPGKGVPVVYKVSSTFAPKPFGYAPASAPMSPPMAAPKSPSSYPPPPGVISPPMAAPKSPSSYPPPSGMPAWSAPKMPQQTFAAAPNFGANTLPRASAAGKSAQVDFDEYIQVAEYETEYEEHRDEIELSQTSSVGNFIWPPNHSEDDRVTPTACPMYFQPPETQHVVPREWHMDKQSYSAPELSEHAQRCNESGPESFTSTDTSSGSADETYSRVYQVQAAPPIQRVYDQAMAGDMTDLQDAEVAAMSRHKQSICSMEVSHIISGRRSAQECAESITNTIGTTLLVDSVRSSTPRPQTPKPEVAKKRVEFSEPITVEQDLIEIQSDAEQAANDEECCVSSVPTEPPAEVRSLPPTTIPNAVPKEWQSAMVKALTTASEKPYAAMSEAYVADNSEPEEILQVEPPKGSYMACALAVAPQSPVSFAPPPNEDDIIGLPEQTEPYLPPPFNFQPERRDDVLSGCKSPMLRALTIAPDQPYSSFGHDVCYQLDDLPTPKETLTMASALTVASDQPYHAFLIDLNDAPPSSAPQQWNTSACAQETSCATGTASSCQRSCTYSATSCQQMTTATSSTLEAQMDRQISAFANVAGVRSVNPFQPKRDSISSLSNGSGVVVSSQIQSQACNASSMSTFTSSTTATATAATSSSNMLMSSAHQQTCAVSQSEQNVSASVESVSLSSHKGGKAFTGLHKPDRLPQYQTKWQQLPSQNPTRTPEPTELRENVPIAFVEAPGDASLSRPVAMMVHGSAALAELKYLESREAHTKSNTATVPAVIVAEPPPPQPLTVAFPSSSEFEPTQRPYTPSLINKPAPTIPYYQQNLIPSKCDALDAHLYDPRSRSPSPHPDRAACKSPAPGPPPNPLRAHAPRLREPAPATSSPTKIPQPSAAVVGSGDYHVSSAASTHSYMERPEQVRRQQVGNTTIQTRSNESQLNQAARAETQAQSTTQVGGTQIQRRTKVVEEFERSQTARTVEIQRTSHTEAHRASLDQDGMPRRGFVATQARRLSGVDSEVSSVTSKMSFGAGAGVDGKPHFPKSPTCEQGMFPVRGQDNFAVNKAPTPQQFEVYMNAMHVPPPGFNPHGELKEPVNQRFTKQFDNHDEYRDSPFNKLPTVAASGASADMCGSQFGVAAVTSAAASMPSYKLTTALPVPAFKPPPPPATSSVAPCCVTGNDRQPPYANVPRAPCQTAPAYKPNPSSGPGFKPPGQNQKIPSAVESDPSPASAGSNKTAAFGATSAPKRGRGVLNKGVGPGVPSPPPPPPPPPAQSIASSKPVSDAVYVPGQATDLLEKSVLKLHQNSPDEYRAQASQLISKMMESRLRANSNSPPKASFTVDHHPLKKIIDVCDKNGSDGICAIPPPPPTQNFHTDSFADQQLPPPPPELVLSAAAAVDDRTTNVINGTHNTNGIKNMNGTNGSGIVHEPTLSATVPLRRKSNNPNDLQSSLTTHARDRRSFIEKENIAATAATDIADELNDGKHPVCNHCNVKITRGPFITALGRIWCPDHFVCTNNQCKRQLADIGFVEEKGNLYCEYCFEKFLAPPCSKCNIKIKGDCLNAIGRHFHPECFTCVYCGKLFGNSPFFLEEGEPYCEADWNELFTTKCFACGFPVEAGDRWVEALSHNYHSQCFNCTMCKKNLEGQSFYAKGGRPYCKNHAR